VRRERQGDGGAKKGENLSSAPSFGPAKKNMSKEIEERNGLG